MSDFYEVKNRMYAQRKAIIQDRILGKSYFIQNPNGEIQNSYLKTRRKKNGIKN